MSNAVQLVRVGAVAVATYVGFGFLMAVSNTLPTSPQVPRMLPWAFVAPRSVTIGATTALLSLAAQAPLLEEGIQIEDAVTGEYVGHSTAAAERAVAVNCLMHGTLAAVVTAGTVAGSQALLRRYSFLAWNRSWAEPIPVFAATWFACRVSIAPVFALVPSRLHMTVPDPTPNRDGSPAEDRLVVFHRGL